MSKLVVVRMTLSVLVSGLVLLSAGNASAQCGGLCLYEVGSFDMGTSGAGAGARAEDPATAFFNPAGLTRLENTKLHVGVVNLIGTGGLEFNVGSGTSPNPPGLPPFAGTKGGGDLGEYLPLAGSFASHKFTDRFSVGFAFTGLWGGDVNYGGDWVGRTFVTRSTLTVIGLQPAVAYRATDWLSFGAGVGAAYGELDLNLRADLALDAATVEIRNADDWGWYFSLGALIEPSERTRIGIYYRYKTELNLAGKVVNPTPLVPSFTGKMIFPQGVNLSAFHQLTSNVALLADVGWSNWSDFGNMVYTVGPVPVTIDRDWRDTWRVGVGVHYQLRETATLMVGFSYDSDPVEDSKRLPDIPVSEGYRFSAGARIPVARNIDLGLTYTFLWMGSDMEIDNLPLPPSNTVVLDGKYDPAHIHFLGIQLSIEFGGESSKG
jgi:long-chain fatty acid transport protein